MKVISNLQLLKVDFEENKPFVILKYKLQLVILENICKQVDSGGANGYYGKLKQETQDFLEFHNQELERRKFLCSLAGCLFKCNRHRNYIRHLKHAHSRESHLVCQFGLKCNQTFSTFDLLEQHIQHSHSEHLHPRTEPAPVDIPCKCSVRRCSGVQLPNTRNLMIHMRNQHLGEVVECIFEECEKKFNNPLGLRSHFSKKHIKLNLCRLKEANLLQPEIFINHPVAPNLSEIELNNEPAADDVTVDINVEDIDGEEEEEEEPDEFFLMAYGDFLNRLANFHFIPQTTIKIISDEYLKNYKKSNVVKAERLKKSIEEVAGLTETETMKVIDDFQSNDPFLEAQMKLDTDYKRTKFIRDHFTYVSPQEIVLNPKAVKERNAKKSVMHYVPIVETFKNLIQDPSFCKVVENNIVSKSTLSDVKDGDLYKNNHYFQQNPEAYVMMLYSDAIELGKVS